MPGMAPKAGTSPNNQTVGCSVIVPKIASVGKRERRGIGRRKREGCGDRRWERSLFGTRRRDGDAGSIRHSPVTASALPAFRTGSCSFARTALTCAPAGVSCSHRRPHRWRPRSPSSPSPIMQDPSAVASGSGSWDGLPTLSRASPHSVGRDPWVPSPAFEMGHRRRWRAQRKCAATGSRESRVGSVLAVLEEVGWGGGGGEEDADDEAIEIEVDWGGRLPRVLPS